LLEDGPIHLLDGKGDHVHGDQGLTPHGIDITEGVGGGNLPEAEGVVHDGREKIDGLDEGNIIGQLIYPGIVQMVYAHQEIRMVGHWKLAQDLVQVPWTDLCGSTRGLGLIRQPEKILFHVNFLIPHEKNEIEQFVNKNQYKIIIKIIEKIYTK
jgi:hypothetical protein